MTRPATRRPADRVYPCVDTAPEARPAARPAKVLTRSERTEMGLRLRRGAMYAVKFADRLDPEHATVIVCEVNAMGQVAKILGGLRKVVEAKDLVIGQRDAQLAQQAGEIAQLEQAVKALGEQLAAARAEPSLDADDLAALADAEPLVSGVLVEPVRIQ